MKVLSRFVIHNFGKEDFHRRYHNSYCALEASTWNLFPPTNFHVQNCFDKQPQLPIFIHGWCLLACVRWMYYFCLCRKHNKVTNLNCCLAEPDIVMTRQHWKHFHFLGHCDEIAESIMRLYVVFGMWLVVENKMWWWKSL